MSSVFTPADILIPNDMAPRNWSVIACDQFTSERRYWERVAERVGNEPSTLNMIIPEAFLGETDEQAAINSIDAAMCDYIKSGFLREISDSFILVERTLAGGHVRRGIVGAIDLEEYDFTGGGAAVLASEGTVLDRLPARIRVRRAALLETPHVMAFIDDKNAAVIEPLVFLSDKLPLLYDFDLMEGGGHITGRRLQDGNAAGVIEAMAALQKSAQALMAIGDGNHSLAAAKMFWDEIKTGLNERERAAHPARRALLEVNNVYDPAIDFEAIHRVILAAEPREFIYRLEAAVTAGKNYEVRWAFGAERGTISIGAGCIGDMISQVQEFIDEYVSETGCGIDYIHGEDSAVSLAGEKGGVALLFPSMEKSELFATVIKKGVFPKKSFSVGHARDKRYYLECRRIRSGA